MEAGIIAKGIEPESAKWPPCVKNWFFHHGGRLDPETGLEVYGQKLETARCQLAFAIQAKEIGAFKPNREKDELTYAIETAEHTGRTRGLGRNTSWKHGFPNDRETYRSRERSKEEQAARVAMLEEMVLQAQEREKAMEARMLEEIRKQVQRAMSAQRQALEPRMVSTKLPNQDDAALRFPVDDVITPMTSIELHVPRGNDTIKVAVGVFTPLDPTKTPRIHEAPI
jgi:hypothetical protein